MVSKHMKYLASFGRDSLQILFCFPVIAEMNERGDAHLAESLMVSGSFECLHDHFSPTCKNRLSLEGNYYFPVV